MVILNPARQADKYVCRVIQGNVASKTAGVGFVIDDRHIITCAHVVNAALERDQRAQRMPSPAQQIRVDFPMSGISPGTGIRTFTVVPTAWAAPSPDPRSFSAEFSGLRLASDEELPSDIGFAPLINHQWVISKERKCARMALFGYPSGRPGTWSRGIFSGVVDNEMLQFEADSAVNPQTGFSGSPLIIEGGENRPDYVVGMLEFAGGGKERDARCLSVMRIWKHWPQLRTSMIHTLVGHLWSNELGKTERPLLSRRFQIAPLLDWTAQQTTASRYKLKSGEKVIGAYIEQPFMSSFKPIGASVAITSLGVRLRSKTLGGAHYIPYEHFPSYSVAREWHFFPGSQASTFAWANILRDPSGRMLLPPMNHLLYELLKKIQELIAAGQDL
jgi:hypothetical protein